MNKKILFFTIPIFLIFGLFIFWITADSPIEKTIQKIEAATNIDDLKMIIQNIDPDLRNDKDVREAAKSKIATLKLRTKQQKDLLSWFPYLETAVNLVIVPDFSKRLKDYPDQAATDIKLIDTIYSCFLETVKGKKINPAKKQFIHDRLLVDVTDPTQAAAVFKSIADSLTIDLNQNRSEATRIWLEKQRPRFTSQLETLYNAAVKQPRGTDYWAFIENKLTDHFQKDDLDTRYRNVLIILTDGYLEAQSGYFTSKAIQTKNPDKNPIPVCPNADLSDWDIYVLEGRERKSGDNQILRKAWYNWLEEMGADLDPKTFYQFNKDQLNFTTRFIRKDIFSLE